ncbi:MAG: OsmC family protein [Chloroflexi bacterium]|nr:OsmC family protein [Chloroflexota bacterium]
MASEGGLDVQVRWVEGLQFVGRAETSGAAIVLDGAPEHGGFGSGPRPMETLLLALAGCTAMDVISILQKKRQKVTGFRVYAHGDRAEEHPRRYTRIKLEFVVRGWDVEEEAVARSIELSQTKYCSVTASVNAEVTYTYRIEQEQVPQE